MWRECVCVCVCVCVYVIAWGMDDVDAADVSDTI